MERMYSLKLGECIYHRNMEILRVPGGWLITNTNTDTGNMVFIPYSKDCLPPIRSS